jgi:hypothetical protein
MIVDDRYAIIGSGNLIDGYWSDIARTGVSESTYHIYIYNIA